MLDTELWPNTKGVRGKSLRFKNSLVSSQMKAQTGRKRRQNDKERERRKSSEENLFLFQSPCISLSNFVVVSQ